MSTLQGTGRQTRSGATYAAWEGILPTDTFFSFEDALLQSIYDERDELEHLFSDSPLSSAPTSRAASPAPADLPSSSAPTPRDAPPAHLSPPPPLSSAAPSTGKSACKKRREKNQGHQRRKRQRQADAGDGTVNTVRPGVRSKFVGSSAPVRTNVQPEGLRVASSGFIGVKSTRPPRVLSLSQLLKLANLRRVPWLGKAPKPLLDRTERVIGLLAGQPPGETWQGALSKAAALLEKARTTGKFSPQQTHHTRGKFPTLASGFAHGGGRTAPCNLRPQNAVNAALVDELLEEHAFERLATFASSVFATWAPRLYAEYAKCMDQLCAHDPDLKRNWPRSVFAAAVFNLGPQTVCYRHKDFANLPYGWCAITALGSFDPQLGGHIVLWQLGLVVEFPPGSTILIPSAVIEHSNAPVRAHETRYSFTQYSAGGLFRWAEHGMKSDKEFFQGLSEEDFNHAATKSEQRWVHGLSLFSTLAELKTFT